MNDMSAVIQPKSDQLNSDSLLGGPITITISKVDLKPGAEQPCTVHYEGEDGKPWKPCKSMARMLVAAWGPDAAKYSGKSLTLFRDPAVTWGGMAVGGIRISYMSHIERALSENLTATRGNKKPFKVQPLRVETQPEPTSDFDFPAFESAIATALETPQTHAELSTWWESLKPERIKARAADQMRAGQSATLINEKLAELANND